MRNDHHRQISKTNRSLQSSRWHVVNHLPHFQSAHLLRLQELLNGEKKKKLKVDLIIEIILKKTKNKKIQNLLNE